MLARALFYVQVHLSCECRIIAVVIIVVVVDDDDDDELMLNVFRCHLTY